MHEKKRDLDGEHLLEAERPCAKLHLVGQMGFRFASLVFDGKHGAVAVKLDDVCLPLQTQRVRNQSQLARNPPA